MILIAGGSHDQNVVCFGQTRMWAERGLIHAESGRDNSYECFSVRTCLHRMKAISDMITNTGQKVKANKANSQFAQITIEEHQRMLEGMCEVVRRAQAQGQPDDASARRDLVRRRKKSVVVPGYGGGL